MADRMEREIEEILAKLDVEAPATERAPISLLARRKKRVHEAPAWRGAQTLRLSRAVNPAALLLVGAAIMVAGLVLSNFWGVLIWAAFAGVVIFLAAFAFSFRRSPRGGSSAATATGHYWRDRYIEYTPARRGIMGQIKHRFRRQG